MMHQSMNSHTKIIKTMVLWTKQFEHPDSCKVGKHWDKLIDSQKYDMFVSHKEPNDSPILDYMMPSEVEKIMGDYI